MNGHENVVAAILSVDNLRVAGGNRFELNVPGLALSAGQMLAVVGTNGSGKTSFLEGVLGFRTRLSGTVSLFGAELSESVKDVKSLRRIGVQLQTVCYSDNFKVRELVDLHRMMYGVADDGVAYALGIDELLKLSYGKLSRGQKQRIDLYIALAHNPELVFLDEASTGLDRGFQESFARLLADRAANPLAATVLCSHDSDEVSICNRVLWLKAGKVHQLIERGDGVVGLSPLVSSKLRLKIDPAHFTKVAELLVNHPAVIHHERMDSRTVLAFGLALLPELALQLRGLDFISEIETYDADSSDFLRIVTSDSGRKSEVA